MGLINTQELDKKTRKYLFDIVLENIRGLRWGNIDDNTWAIGLVQLESRAQRSLSLWPMGFLRRFPISGTYFSS